MLRRAHMSLRVLVCSCCAAALVMTAGCGSDGLAPQHSQASLVPNTPARPLAFYDPKSTSPITTSAQPAKFPIKAAIVQLDQVAAPDDMLQKLRAHPELFSKLITLPGLAEERETPTEQMNRLRQVTQQMGLDYVLIFGGIVDHGSKGTALCIADITIVGAFIVPSRGVEVKGRATAALVECTTGRLVTTFSSQADHTAAVPSAFVEVAEHNSVEARQSELIAKLTEDIIAHAKQQSVN